MSWLKWRWNWNRNWKEVAWLRKFPGKWILGLLLLGALAGGAVWYFLPGQPSLPPQDLVNQSIKNTLQAPSYRYVSMVRLQVNGREEIFSRMEGEKASPQDFHIQGELLNNTVDIYQLGNTMYQKDPLTGQWIILENNNLARARLLLADIDPFNNLNFQEVLQAQVVGKDTIEGRRVFVLQCVPKVAYPALQLLWKDFTCRLWVDEKNLLVRKALVRAVSKNDPKDSLEFQVEIRNYGEKLELRPPI